MSATLTNTGALLRLDARRDRIRGTVWVLGVSIFVPYVMVAYATLLSGSQEMAGILSMVANPAMTLFTGPGYGLSEALAESDLAAQVIFAGVYWGYVLIFVALMNILLISRHTRAEEQSGRAELLRALPSGRGAALTAALLWALVCNVALGVLVTLSLIAFESPPGSSLLLGLGTVAFGLFFGALTAVTAQLSSFSSATSGMAGAVLAAAFLVRGLGDMIAPAGEHGTWLSWLSPFAWAQQTRVFVEDRWWPILILLGCAAVLVAVAYLLAARRDFGAGMLQVRAGRSRAGAWVGSPLSVSWLILRSQAMWWSLALLLFGLMYGAFTGAMVDAFADLPDLFRHIMGGAQGALEGYLTLTTTMFHVAFAAYAVVAISKLRTEEAEGRLEPLLASPITSRAWVSNAAAIIAVVTVGLAILEGTVAGAFAVSVDGDWSWMSQSIAAALVGIPAVGIVWAIAAVLYAVAPRLMGLAWIPIVAGFLISMFGDLLDLPGWARQISPFEHTPQLPTEVMEWPPILIQTVVALGLISFAVAWIGRRDIPST
ncbi:MAG: ABC transporter permease [Arachnia sp.]